MMATHWTEEKYGVLTQAEQNAVQPLSGRPKSPDSMSTSQMAIREMSKEECLLVMGGARLARLACAHENQPYVVPVYLAYHEASGYLYGFTTPGQKVAWMRANPRVCVEVDEVAAPDQWMSVIATGRYEELPETPGSDDARIRAQERPRQAVEAMLAGSAGSRKCDDERLLAWEVLKTLPEWWQPGCAAWASRAHRNPAEPFIGVYYRIRVEHVTGHEATRPPPHAISYAATAPPAGRLGWLGRALSHVFGGK